MISCGDVCLEICSLFSRKSKSGFKTPSVVVLTADNYDKHELFQPADSTAELDQEEFDDLDDLDGDGKSATKKREPKFTDEEADEILQEAMSDNRVRRRSVHPKLNDSYSTQNYQNICSTSSLIPYIFFQFVDV